MNKLSYRLRIYRWYYPWGRIYTVYRHEIDGLHLTLFESDGSVLAIPMARLAWRVYPEYWTAMEQYDALRRSGGSAAAPV